MKLGTFLIALGFFLTFGAVGGIEFSKDDLELIEATVLAGLGLSIAYAGVLMLQVHKLDFYNKTVDNPTLR